MLKSIKDKYQVNINDYTIIRELNRGGFGIIYLVYDKIKKEELVAKVNLINTGQECERRKQFVKRELEILMRIQHPTIIPLRGFSFTDFRNDKNITILMDYVPMGSLLSLIEMEQKGLCPIQYDNTKRQILLAGIARGLMILHSRNVIHRDLSSGNILLDENIHPIVTDFGLSKFFDPLHSKSQTLSDSGTIYYMAPEVIESNRYDISADVYSFGILMYEILTGSRPYKEVMSNKNMNAFQFQKLITQGMRPEIKVPIKEELKRLMEQCWSHDPSERPTSSELFQKLSLWQCEHLLENSESIQIDALLSEEGEDFNACCLDNVNLDEFHEYIDSITEEIKQVDEMRKIIEEMKSTISKQEEQISSLKEKNSNLEKQISVFNSKYSYSFNTGNPDLTKPGIFQRLKKHEKKRFNPLFIKSQSSKDPYNLINPEVNDYFLTNSSNENCLIKFQLEKEIMIKGVKIFSSAGRFPKSFNILIGKDLVYSSTEENDLNGPYKEKTIEFPEKKGKTLSFVKTGPSWDLGNMIMLKRIEILSSDEKYTKGVFQTLVDKYKDPHLSKVLISSTSFVNDTFYLINTSDHISTGFAENSWFQVELTKGLAIINGFRVDLQNLKSFKIIATEDKKKPINSWIELYEFNENQTSDSKNLTFCMLPQQSIPVKCIRLIQTKPNRRNKKNLVIYHFDIFGKYFE